MKVLSQNILWKAYSSKTDAEQILILSTLFSLSLEAVCIFYTGHLSFLFLVWNLFLAWLPYALSARMSRINFGNAKIKLLLLALIWLLLVPNAFYIITDLFHLGIDNHVPLWFDLALLLSFAWNGLLFGIISVRQMEKIIELHFNKKFDLQFVLPIMFLNGLGVYVGRYLRFNSWDVITNPLQLANDIFYLLFHPIRNRFDWSMIICYSVLMTLIYLAIKRLSKDLA